jgi:hypothetical protein
MRGDPPRWPHALALAASLLGLAFAGVSTLDYTKHLDRRVHDLHCSFVPGVAPEHGSDNACRAAMYSPFSAIFRDRYWGGVPISLFAVGAFVFFAAFCLYVLLAGRNAPRRAVRFLGIAGLSPLAVSALMFSIAWLKIGEFCRTCVGIYIASTALAVGAVVGMIKHSGSSSAPPAYAGGDVTDTVVDPVPPFAEPPSAAVAVLFVLGWLAALGLSAATPALLYLSALPSYAQYVGGCGTLEKATESHGALLRMTPAGATQPATLFVDPLCPTCRALHTRLSSDGILEQLDTTLVLFPLDDACNWMLDRPVHPGSCIVSRAVLCADRRAQTVLEWAYDNQDAIKTAGASGAGLVNVRAMIRERFPDLDACVDAKETGIRLDRMLHYIIDNHLAISTPQLFLGGTRLCDEDSDIGLPYTLKRLAPGLRQP